MPPASISRHRVSTTAYAGANATSTTATARSIVRSLCIGPSSVGKHPFLGQESLVLRGHTECLCSVESHGEMMLKSRENRPEVRRKLLVLDRRKKRLADDLDDGSVVRNFVDQIGPIEVRARFFL